MRANIPMWYTKGFNPHAKLVFGVPLSVGTESMCEMADLKIERQIDLEEIKNQLNEQLTDEMYVLEAYYPTTKFNDIAYADYTITLKSDKISSGDADKITSLFSSPVTMTKRSKSGEKEVDITAFIKKLDASVDVLVSHELVDEIEREFVEELGILLIGHLDPIVINDDEVNELRDKVYALLHDIDEDFSMHDFRMVKGEKRTNVIFDVAIPYGTKLSSSEIKDKLEKGITLIDKKYCPVIIIEYQTV